MTVQHTQDDPIHADSTTFSVSYVPGDGDVELKVSRWDPLEPASEDPVVFVPGWASSIEGWSDLLRALAAERPLLYIESREKKSARIAKRKLSKNDFTIEKMARDLVAVGEGLEIDLTRTVFSGSSVGSTSILQALKKGELQARGAFVIGPNGRFPFPLWAKAMSRVPASTYGIVIRIVLFYLRNFRVNASMEPQQMKRYEQTLVGAHPLRMKLSAQAFYPFEIWEDLSTIGAPVAVAYAPTDTLHGEGDIKRIVETIPDARPVECPTNLYMHCADIASDIEAFIASLQ